MNLGADQLAGDANVPESPLREQSGVAGSIWRGQGCAGSSS